MLIHSDYRPNLLLRNGDLQSILPTLFRRTKFTYTRQRIETFDGDFLDLDWSRRSSKKLVIMLHGLEGSSESQYMLGMAHYLFSIGYDVLSLNFRGCSGEPNRKIFSYHSGETRDLDFLLNDRELFSNYDDLYLVGFSIGGNVILKFLGERGSTVNKLRAAVAFSVPCDLKSGALRLALRRNQIYMRRFLKCLKEKQEAKYKLFPESISLRGFSGIRNFFDYDSRYIVPHYGFKDAFDYWAQASSKPYIPEIKIPTLLVSSTDDPFLDENCFPIAFAKESSCFSFELCHYGGHNGFILPLNNNIYWSELRAGQFLSTY